MSLCCIFYRHAHVHFSWPLIKAGKNEVGFSVTINGYQKPFIHPRSRFENTALMLFEIKLLCRAERK